MDSEAPWPPAVTVGGSKRSPLGPPSELSAFKHGDGGYRTSCESAFCSAGVCAAACDRGGCDDGLECVQYSSGAWCIIPGDGEVGDGCPGLPGGNGPGEQPGGNGDDQQQQAQAGHRQ